MSISHLRLIIIILFAPRVWLVIYRFRVNSLAMTNSSKHSTLKSKNLAPNLGTKPKRFNKISKQPLKFKEQSWSPYFLIKLPWSSLVEGDEGSNLPNCQTNLVIALHAVSLLFCKVINTAAYHLGRYMPSSPVSCCTPHIVYLASVRLNEQISPKFIKIYQLYVTSQRYKSKNKRGLDKKTNLSSTYSAAILTFHNRLRSWVRISLGHF